MEFTYSDLERKCRTGSLVLIALTVSLSLLILYGWIAGLSGFTNLFPEEAVKEGIPHIGQVGSTAAICMICLSSILAFLMLDKSEKLGLKYVIPLVLLIIISLINIAFQLGVFGIQAELNPSGLSFPVPMLTQTSITVLLFSAALMTYRVSIKNLYPFQIISLFIIFCAVVVLLGATTKVQSLCTVGRCFTPSIGYSFIALSLACAIYLSKPGLGAATTFSSQTIGGILLRRLSLLLLIPSIFLVLRIPNFILVNGEPILNLQMCNAFASGISVILMAYLAWSGAKVANTIERDLLEKSETLSQLQQSRASFLSDGEESQIAALKYKKVCMECGQEYDDSVVLCARDKSPLNRIIDNSLVGTIFADRFKIEDQLGAGAMSTVYRAKHLGIGKTVAVKVLNDTTMNSGDGLLRFKREATAIGKLSHQNIVGVTDFGLSTDGRPYLVMEHCEGETLSNFIDINGALDSKTFYEVAEQLFNALQHAHDNGIIHRDLKPSNVMIEKVKGFALGIKVVDFGLAKILEPEAGQALNLTQTGECLGSPLYMCPEQCKGLDSDARSDIYSLGCIMFECLTGYPPIVGKNVAETIKMHVQDKPAPFPDDSPVPYQLKIVIYKTLHKEPGDRPQSIRELRKLLFSSMSDAKL